MKVLAIDPGYDRCGVAVVEGDRNKPSLVFSTCLRTSSKDSFHIRLAQIGKEIERIIEIYAPNTCAIEKLYFNTNQKTAMHVAEVRGMLLYVALSHGLEVQEYTPLQVKQAIVGHGHADKQQIMLMLPKLVHFSDEQLQTKPQDDEYDAIAIGITALAYSANSVVKR